MEKGNGVQIQSVVRASEILQLFFEFPELGISEIAAKMRMSKSTAYGLTNTLAAVGYLEQSPQNKRYRLGLRLFELGNLVQRRLDVREEAAPWCRALSEHYNTTVHLAIQSQGEIVYIDKMDNENALVMYSRIGKRGPMYCTGVGKAILAFLPHEYLREHILSKELVKLTPNTIDSHERLLYELEQVRAQGYAMDNEEIEPGLNCVAAPVFNHEKVPVAGISISFPWGRIRSLDQPQLVRDVLNCAAQISARMGFAGK